MTTTFYKANVASLTASLCDYLITIIFIQFLKIDPVQSSIMGTVTGGVINFWIGRNWVFKSMETSFLHQGKKYFFSWIGNLLLNALGAFLLIRLGKLHYLVSKVATSITVAVAYNYPVQKRYVFKSVEINEKN